MVRFQYNPNKWTFMEKLDTKFWRGCVAEGFAMFFFVVLCCGCAMVTLNLDRPNYFMIAMSFGFGILIIAQVVGPLSGGHINCAVSLGLFIAGRITFIKLFCYTMFQMAGSIIGACCLWAIFGNDWPAAKAFGSNSWDPERFTSDQVFFAEMLGTMLLMFNVLSTVDIPEAGGGRLGVLPIAMSVMVAHLFLLHIDGCSINPTRSFGPAVIASAAGIAGDYAQQQYMFWLAPLFGASLAAIIYEYGSLKPKKFDGAGDMRTAIFEADKKREETPKQPSPLVNDEDMDEVLEVDAPTFSPMSSEI